MQLTLRLLTELPHKCLPLFLCQFTHPTLRNTERKLQQSGMTVAPPERTKSDTKHLPVPSLVPTERKRRSDLSSSNDPNTSTEAISGNDDNNEDNENEDESEDIDHKNND